VYTIIVIILILISIRLILTNKSRYHHAKFYLWLVTSCVVGWSEFIGFLRYDAWLFDPQQIIGIRFLGVTIEDYIFCPTFAIIFYWMYFKTKNMFFQRKSNPKDKLIFMIIIGLVAFAYYIVGSPFSKYMSLRFAIGSIGLFYCWNFSSFRQNVIFLFVVFCIGFLMDLVCVNLNIWHYPIGDKALFKVFNGSYLTLLNAKFPIEIFAYYFSGGFFSFGMLSLYDKYFTESSKKLPTLYPFP